MKTTIQKIQELVPDVMKLEFGCRISVTADGYGSCNESTGCEDYSAGIDEVGIIIKGCDEICFMDGSGMGDIYVSSFKEGYNEDYEMTFEILGKPITLAVVLRAIMENDGLPVTFLEAEKGEIGHDWENMMFRFRDMNWNLSKDNFNDQSDETKAFIGGLLN